MNTCVPATLIQFVDQENEPNMKIIYGFLLPILSVAVLISNGVVILVMNGQKSKRVTVEPLLWMAVSALLMAASPLPFTIFYYDLGHMRDLNQTIFLCYLQKYPLDSLRWCSRRLMHRYSKAIFVLSAILTVIHSTFDVRGPSTSFWVARCFIGHSPLTQAMGPNALAWVFDCFRIGITVIPSTLLFIITLLLIRTIKTSDAPRLSMNRHRRVSSASRNTTVMLTVIIVLFLVARAPSTILIVLVKLSDLLPLGSLEFAHSVYLRAFSNIILVTLHPISFAVYMLMSRRFRVSLRSLLGWRFLASDEDFNAMTSSVKSSQFKSFLHKSNATPSVNDRHS
uniref:G_PROTEIN_RECEP_F1_2 domain-containing protein n=1 Tax=Angiostrongylus cantonensis TaxID=6313 RepID=A0A0K0DNS7_ANGCA